jgi:hypothetical protein
LKPIYVSSSACALPASPAALLADWEGRCRGAEVTGLCLDPRLDHELQHEVLALCRSDVACLEIGHPVPGRPAASAISEDRDERSTARRELVASGRRAHEFGVGRVVVLPWLLPGLTPAPARLAERFQRSLDPGIAALEDARAALARPALDACCLTLDPTLRELDGLDVQLVLLRPTPWPHQFPDADELSRLARVFDGAPLASSLAVDWWHVGRHLDRAPGTPGGAPVVHVADACGLSSGLPVGTGELDWDAVAPALESAEAAVLTYDAALCATPREVATGVTLLGKLAPPAPPAPPG